MKFCGLSEQRPYSALQPVLSCIIYLLKKRRRLPLPFAHPHSAVVHLMISFTTANRAVVVVAAGTKFVRRQLHRSIITRIEERRGQHRRFSLDAVALTAVATATALFAADSYYETDLADADSAAACRYPAASRLIRHQHVRELEQDGFTVLTTGVLSADELRQAQKDVWSLLKRRTNDKSRIRWSSSRTNQHGNDSDIRSDQICWVRESDGTNASATAAATVANNDNNNNTNNNSQGECRPHGDGLFHAIKLVRGVVHGLENHGYVGSHHHQVPKQCQLSRYSGDGKANYRRHLDKCDHTIHQMGLFNYWRASDYRGRVITVILYLNDANWTSGGSLRCFHANTTESERDESGGTKEEEKVAEDSYTDVSPKGGTMIIFDSSRLEHAVLPSTRDRFALTCWINGT